ncbi:redoxin domain-containing protein [Planctomycetes bacterium K23_9]|uniref:Thiol-disulfide oxidoreductase n=1 Tax=Stieleria marina TaxID=1930275 RepID=A0A517NPK1_9BACT|nr:thiol-disulfide oxidoreductase [Planctomycetes bacterium K23_9]
MNRIVMLLGLAASMLLASDLVAAHPPGFNELAIGDAAPVFKLPGIDGRDWSLADFSDAQILMVYFTSNHCPVCHAHDPRLVKLLAELKGKPVSVVAINPNSGDGLRLDELGYSKYDDSFDDMTPYAKDEGFTFPYLYDGETQATAKKYGCLATSHVFLFDQDRKLQYKGAFDDSRYPDPSTVKKQSTRNALLEMLSGKPVTVAVTKPFGCSTKWREKISLVKQDDKNWASADVTLDDIDAGGIAKLVANDTDKFRLFNVWSTTCVPCVEEFPGLTQVSRRMGLRKFELITISTDLPKDRAAVTQFLSRNRAVLPKRLAKSLEAEGRKSNNYLYTDPSMSDLIEALDPAWEGPQPHSVLVAPGGKVVFRHNGAIGADELLDVVLKEMSTGYQPDSK